ncbi:expressed hypothetical protein [Trichoplax adhaerens]|uniref:Translocation protein SEC62 n=1 Tax=Trichoplax adhaerens TaxID=10228 RepID=B3S016_TRIAD|nr:expressed hypothetical protein [Trichoplax adhaerens]EDV23929.1 expressed hypothetical protein [Trichoplax adhaerens]|eukprot:XP_002113455.1 expressed hypothetical protein [Trichoplax adhaerens]
MTIRARKGKKVIMEVEEQDQPPQQESPLDTKLVQEILTDLRKNLKTKAALLHKEEVDYFIGQHAVNYLMDSKWATGDDDAKVIFVDRADAIEFCQQLLLQRNFVRCGKAKKKKWTPFKVAKSSTSDHDKNDGDSEETKAGNDNATKNIKTSDSNKDEDYNDEDAKDDQEPKDDNIPEEEQKEGAKDAGKKKKKKIKLKEHKEQEFLDSDDLYAWIFQITSPYNYLIGIVMMAVFMLYNLLPIMPAVVGHYLSQLSTVLLFIVIGIICLAIGRYLLFILVWMFTLGKYHFWLLPQLFADCSFLESFTPVFSLQEYKPSSKTKNKSERKKSSSKKAKVDNDGVKSGDTKHQAEVPDNNQPKGDERLESSKNEITDTDNDWEKLDMPVENEDDSDN